MFKNTEWPLERKIASYLQVFSLCDIQYNCGVKMAGTSQLKKEHLCLSFHSSSLAPASFFIPHPPACVLCQWDICPEGWTSQTGQGWLSLPLEVVLIQNHFAFKEKQTPLAFTTWLQFWNLKCHFCNATYFQV